MSCTKQPIIRGKSDWIFQLGFLPPSAADEKEDAEEEEAEKEDDDEDEEDDEEEAALRGDTRVGALPVGARSPLAPMSSWMLSLSSLSQGGPWSSEES